MCHKWIMTLLLVLGVGSLAGHAGAQDAKPGGPLTCHGVVCPAPTSSCQMLESDKCIKGGGPPHCPAIVNVANGTSCNDGNACTIGDVCTSGVCAGTPVVCSSPTDMCTPSGACATPCGPSGCVVSAANGFGNPTLTVPPGALSASIVINMVDQGGDPSDASVFHVYSFAPSGTTFATPATVDLPAPPPSPGMQPVIEVSDDGTTWTPVATSLANGRVSGPIAHFSFCHTRSIVATGPSPTDLVITDMVDYQDLIQVKPTNGLTIPPPGEAGSCYSGDYFGLCFKLTNNGASTTPITSTCPVPTPSPPPAGCLQVHVVPWQCYTTERDFPAPFDPATMGGYEGQHCDFTGILVSCPEGIYNLDSFLPPGGLGAGQSVWADLSFYANATPLAGGTSPYNCLGSSFVGFDVLLREPSGTDWQSGMRSAKDGVCIDVPMGTQIYIKSTLDTCNPGLPIGTYTCTLATCQASWDSRVSHDPANYPTLRCLNGTTPIDCSLFQPGDTAYKNWLNDAQF